MRSGFIDIDDGGGELPPDHVALVTSTPKLAHFPRADRMSSKIDRVGSDSVGVGAHVPFHAANHGTGAGIEEIRDGDGRQNSNDRHDDQQFDQCKTFFPMIYTLQERLELSIENISNPNQFYSTILSHTIL